MNVYLGLHTQSYIDYATFEVKTPAVRRRVNHLIKVISTFEIVFGFKKKTKKFNDFILFSQHEKFNPKQVQDGYDIAILILDEEVSFTCYIQAACLPNNNILYPSFDTAGAIVGWGYTDGSISTIPSDLQNVKVYVADGTTDERCTLYDENENIMCLGFNTNHFLRIFKELRLELLEI